MFICCASVCWECTWLACHMNSRYDTNWIVLAQLYISKCIVVGFIYYHWRNSNLRGRCFEDVNSIIIQIQQQSKTTINNLNSREKQHPTQKHSKFIVSCVHWMLAVCVSPFDCDVKICALWHSYIQWLSHIMFEEAEQPVTNIQNINIRYNHNISKISCSVISIIMLLLPF